MTYRDDARNVLISAESSVRSLTESALATRAYSDVASLASIADALRRLVEEVGGAADSPPAGIEPTAHIGTRAIARSTRPPAARRDRRQYPLFERDGDKLIKIGWSKKAREEYEHRAPRSAVLAFAEHLGARTSRGVPFLIEELLPVRDAAGQELPSYQVYLALAWLRQVGAVAKHGRNGYSRTVDVLDGSAFETLWARVSERS